MSAYFSGYFNKGEINTPTIVHTAKQFKNIFGTATDENYNDWYQAYNYLQYSPNLIVTRAVQDATNAYAGYPTLDVPVVIHNRDDWEAKYTNLAILPENSLKIIAKTPGSWANGIQVAIITLLEWEANVVVYGNFRARDLIKYMQPDEYLIIIIRNGLIVETFRKAYDAWEDLNAESLYVYVKANTANPTGYHDGNVLMFDGNGARRYDGNEFFDYNIPIAYGEGIITLAGGGQTAPTLQDIKDSYALVDSVETYQFNIVIGNERDNQAAIDLAEARRDCIAFIGSPNIPIENVMEYRLRLGDSEYTTFIAEYKYQHDGFSDSYRWMNIAGDIAGLKAKSDVEHDEWFAAAGLTRGNILNCTKIKYQPSTILREEWYKESINTILYQSGFYLAGQKTMVYRAKVYDRVSIRALFNIVEREVSKLARNSVFEINDVHTRNSLVSLVKPHLARIKAGRGIYDYQVVCNTSNNPKKVVDSKQLIIDIKIQPTLLAEFIRLRFTCTGNQTMADIVTRSLATSAAITQSVAGNLDKVRGPLTFGIPLDAIFTESGLPITSEAGEYITL